MLRNLYLWLKMKTSRSIEEIKQLAMRDELFESEVTQIDPYGQEEWERDNKVLKSITVIQPKEKHFRNRRYVIVPSWNEDLDQEIDCLLL